MPLPLKINKDWTLFLDRDGVINKKLNNDYVKRIDEFDFIPFARQAIALLNKYFGRIIVITNQQGVGKGIMSKDNVKSIHNFMCAEILKVDGKLDAIYFCPDLEHSGSINRKPQTGMALQAKQDFPDIDFSKTIIVGDSLTDMEFGKKLNLITVYLTDDVNRIQKNNFLFDYYFSSLKEFSEFIYESNKL